MFQSKDGRKFGSKFPAKRRDEEHDKMAKSVLGGDTHEAKETPEFEKGEQEGVTEKPEANENDPKQVVAKHGKAHTVHTAHDHKAGKHHVVSTHADGHVHTSDHASAKDAHSAAQQLAGDSTIPTETTEAPAAPEADGFSMPRLA